MDTIAKRNQSGRGKRELEEFKKRIHAARAKLGLSQSQASKAWGVNLRTLQSWELGRYKPKGLALAQLETILERAAKKGEIGRRSRAR